MTTDQKLVRRFLREMAILSKLRHDNIVRYYGGGKDKTQHFYAMEYMDGGSIEQVLKKKGRFSWEETIDNRPPDRPGARIRPQSRHHSSRSQAGQPVYGKGRPA